jgi:putative endonuclease
MNDLTHWIYILNCENNTFYTGYTTDIAKRYKSHVEGTGGCKYTRSFKPLSIAQYWQVLGGKSEALKLEAHIKKLSRQEKIALIAEPHKLAEVYDCEAQISYNTSSLKRSPR